MMYPYKIPFEVVTVIGFSILAYFIGCLYPVVC